MAQKTYPLHEGVKYDFDFTINSDTATELDGETAILYCYLNGTEKELGSTTIDGTELSIRGDSDELLPNKRYIIEIWVNKGLESRNLLHPSEEDDEDIYIKDREGVAIE